MHALNPHHTHINTRTRIKICGLTREVDVDAAVAAGVDAVGFVLYEKSPRCVSPIRASELAKRLPSFVMPVLLLVNANEQQIKAAMHQFQSGMLQFHGDESPSQCRIISEQLRRPYMRAARIPAGDAGASFNLVKYAQDYSEAQAILLDTEVEGYGGGGKAFNWSLLPPSVNAHLVLSGGLNAANVGDGIAQLRTRCLSLSVDVSSGVEASSAQGLPLKGIKDALKIEQLVAAVKAADLQFISTLGQQPSDN